MAASTVEGWGTGSGLPDQLTGTVAEAWFGKNEQAEGEQADKVYLWLKLINIESNEYDGDEYTVRLGVGSGWEAVEGGERLVREDGTSKPINNNTHYGNFLNRVIGAGKDGQEFAEAMAGAFDAVKGRGNQYQASVWVGLRFEFVNKEFSNSRDGETIEWSWMLPVKFGGEDNRVGGGGGNGAAPAAETNGTTTDLASQLAAIAKDTGSHAEFVGKALAVPGVSADNDLLARVADESDAGIYATARA